MRLTAAILLAIAYTTGAFAWIYLRIRNGKTRKDAGDEGADWSREGTFDVHGEGK